MPTESFLVTALPYSARPDAPFHVSLFVAHRLVPDQPQGELRDFEHVRDWTAQAAGATYRLVGHRTGQPDVDIEVEPLLEALDPNQWARVFPPDLPVVPAATKDHTAAEWRTFPAHRMDVHARGVHEAAMVASPVVPPVPTQMGLTDEVCDSLQYPFNTVAVRDAREGKDHPRGHRDRPGSGHLTRYLDMLVGEVDVGLPGSDLDRRATEILDRREPGRVGAGPGPSTGPFTVTDALADVHAARRYYQRPEDEVDYRPQPDPDAEPPERPTAPPVEFHQRAGRLGDVSALLRRLGLVVDLKVRDVGQLAGLTAISAEVVVPGLDNQVPRQPQTAVSTTGRLFTTVSSSPRWTHGMLRLGDEELFTLLDLDPDASALKLENYLRIVPRLLAVEGNGGEGESAAPAALRSTGFAVAETERATALHDRVDHAPQRAAAVLAGNPGPPLELEQVSRGIRLEVFDDGSGLWHSLHQRLVDVTVDGTPVLSAEEDEAFLQGASLTSSDSAGAPTTYAHEVLAGWDGWSLAAPRPEKTIVHEDGDEVPTAPGDVEPDARRPDPVHVTSAAAPGTLPRLRYGRRYAFRAYSVDLAGNSVGPAADAPRRPRKPSSGLLHAASELVASRQTAVDGVDARPGPAIPASRAFEPDTVAVTPDLDLRHLDRLGRLDIEARGPDLTRLLDAPARVARPDRTVAIERAFAEAVEVAPHVLQRSDATTPPDVLARALDTTLTGPRGLLQTGLEEGPLIADLLKIVTTPRPFLRWAPLVEPAVVPRAPYSTGESLLHLVIRSDVDPDGTITPPTTDSQRHLAPPKTSLLEAETHGMLDEAIGTSGAETAAVRRTALGLALREAGTFLSTTVADPAQPGQSLPVDGIALELPPNAAPLPDPVTGVPEIPDLATLSRGDPLLPGQYVTHDVDELVVPYLPDPAATALSLVFPDADPLLRAAETMAGHLGVQSLTLRYDGTWPLVTAYRLVLHDGPQLDGLVEGNVLSIAVPAGERLRVRLSSAMEPETLELFGLWRTLHGTIKDVPQIAEAAADGWLWWLTPAAEMTLVHAVPRPVEAPRLTSFLALRGPGDATAQLVGGVVVHSPSTNRVDVEARWTEHHDDLAKPGPESVEVTGVACHAEVGYDESLVLLGGGSPPPRTHLAEHHFADTKHRVVDYTVRGTTRYREYFDIDTSVGSRSRVSEVRRVEVPSTVRPTKVHVRDVLPLLRWSDDGEHGGTQVAQPFGVRRTRRAGLRLYLDRPWFTTGEGELLGVVLGAAEPGGAPVSQWAADPVWGTQQGPTASGTLPLAEPLHLLRLDDRAETARPVRLDPVTTVTGQKVLVAGYVPQYNADRRLWYVDVALDPGTAFWPFVRLVVARYQPSSLKGLELGPVVQCDFAQLVPERSASVSRTDEGHVKVSVTGPVGLPRRWSGGHERTPAERLAPSRTMRVRLEQRIPEIDTDLGWAVVSAAELPVLAVLGYVVTWEGVVVLPAPPDQPSRPGRDAVGDLRIVVEEEERLLADPGPTDRPGEVNTGSRVVYLDDFVL